MAKIFYELRQNKNNLSKIFGKWFAHSKTVETLNTRKLAQHISEHGSIYTPDVVYGVLEKFRSCLIEMLLDSKRVKIDGLQEQEMNISSREFFKKAEFINIDSLKGSGSESGGGSQTGGGNDDNNNDAPPVINP